MPGLEDVDLATMTYVDWFNHRRVHSGIAGAPATQHPPNKKQRYRIVTNEQVVALLTEWAKSLSRRATAFGARTAIARSRVGGQNDLLDEKERGCPSYYLRPEHKNAGGWTMGVAAKPQPPTSPVRVTDHPGVESMPVSADWSDCDTSVSKILRTTTSPSPAVAQLLPPLTIPASSSFR